MKLTANVPIETFDAVGSRPASLAAAWSFADALKRSERPVNRRCSVVTTLSALDLSVKHPQAQLEWQNDTL
jgi:hypothetical protein